MVSKLTWSGRWLWPTLVILITALAALVGTSAIEWREVWEPGSAGHQIFWNLRVPRVAIAFMAGGGLAVSGLVFQAVFLNPLATPYTLGLSSGASFGAACTIVFGALPGLLAGAGAMGGAFLGALAALIIILSFARSQMGHQRHVMLLAGVAVAFFFSSLLLLLQFVASFYQSYQIVRWLMGGIAVAGYTEVGLVLPLFLLVMIVLFRNCQVLNLLQLGDDLAHSRGLDVRRAKRRLIWWVSLLVATLVSVTGPIGFIGMIVPHVCRIFWGGNYRVLLPMCIWIGGGTLVLCDLLARMLLAPTGIPVGVITSLFGGPFFFFMLWKRPYRF